MKMCRSTQTGKYLRALLGYDMGSGYDPGSYPSGDAAWFEKKQSGMPIESVNHAIALLVKDVTVFDPR